jgi:hypothetical protein
VHTICHNDALFSPRGIRPGEPHPRDMHLHRLRDPSVRGARAGAHAVPRRAGRA